MELRKITTLGKCRVLPKWRYRKSIGINSLYYIYSGGGGYTCKGINHRFQPGMLYFFPSTADFIPFNDIEHCFEHSYIDFQLFPPLPADDVLLFDPQTDPLTKAACQVFRTATAYKTENNLQPEQFLAQSSLSRMCLGSVSFLLERIAQQYGIKPVDDPVITSVINEMHSHLDSRISVESLAAAHFMTPENLIRRFKAALGVTPYAYFKNLRIRTAISMLNEGKKLSEAAVATGYSDSSALLHAISTAQK